MSEQPAETEAEFQSWVVDLARVNGWLVWYQPDWVYRLVVRDMEARRRKDRDWPDKGFPDLWLVHPRARRLVVIECKSETGTVRADQRRWIGALAATGVDVVVARPRDRGEIERLLAA